MYKRWWQSVSFKVPLISKICFSFCSFSGKFLCVHWKMILSSRPMSMICEITTRLEVNPSPICNLFKCDVETWSRHCPYMDFTVIFHVWLRELWVYFGLTRAGDCWNSGEMSELRQFWWVLFCLSRLNEEHFAMIKLLSVNVNGDGCFWLNEIKRIFLFNKTVSLCRNIFHTVVSHLE